MVPLACDPFTQKAEAKDIESSRPDLAYIANSRALETHSEILPQMANKSEDMRLCTGVGSGVLLCKVFALI